MDMNKYSLFMSDVAAAKKSPKNDEALAQIFNKHKDFIKSLDAEEALLIEKELGFWSFHTSE